MLPSTGPGVDPLSRQHDGVWTYFRENMAPVQSVHPESARQESGRYDHGADLVLRT